MWEKKLLGEPRPLNCFHLHFLAHRVIYYDYNIAVRTIKQMTTKHRRSTKTDSSGCIVQSN